MGYNVTAYNMDGEGGLTLAARNVPAIDLAYTVSLSGVDSMRFLISPENSDVTAWTLVPWKTLVILDYNGKLIGGGIVSTKIMMGHSMELECFGLMGYFADQPFRGSKYFINTDPAKIFRVILRAAQKYPMGNLGLKVTSTFNSGTTVGEKPKTNAESDDSEGPYGVSWESASDILDVLNELADLGEFDYWVDWRWSDEGTPEPFLRMLGDEDGYESYGRLELGVNVTEMPSRTNDSQFANTVAVIGGGKGKKKIVVTSDVAESAGRLSRVKVVNRPRVLSRKRAKKIANRLAKRYAKLRYDLSSEIRVINHPTFRLTSLAPGKIVRFISAPGNGYGMKFNKMVKITSITFEPDTDSALLTIIEATDPLEEE